MQCRSTDLLFACVRVGRCYAAAATAVADFATWQVFSSPEKLFFGYGEN